MKTIDNIEKTKGFSIGTQMLLLSKQCVLRVYYFEHLNTPGSMAILYFYRIDRSYCTPIENRGSIFKRQALYFLFRTSLKVIF